MARYRAGFDTGLDPRMAFAYLADFSNAQEWDPGVVEATRASTGPIGVGSTFRLVVSFGGRRMTLDYQITAYDQPSIVVLETAAGSFDGIDTITVEPVANGCRVTYDARLMLKGIWRFADPLLALMFRRTGDRALEGLKRTLEQRARRSA